MLFTLDFKEELMKTYGTSQAYIDSFSKLRIIIEISNIEVMRKLKENYPKLYEVVYITYVQKIDCTEGTSSYLHSEFVSYNIPQNGNIPLLFRKTYQKLLEYHNYDNDSNEKYFSFIDSTFKFYMKIQSGLENQEYPQEKTTNAHTFYNQKYMSLSEEKKILQKEIESLNLEINAKRSEMEKNQKYYGLLVEINTKNN